MIFEKARTCIKCGSQARWTYQKAAAWIPEHMVRTCRDCGFKWYEYLSVEADAKMEGLKESMRGPVH